MNWRRRIDELAAEFGAEIETTGSGHLRMRHPDGWIVIVSRTPSDTGRALKNVISELRRQARGGAKVYHRKR